VKYDTTTVISSGFNDTIAFSALENGEVFTVSGGNGTNTIDLSNYTGDKITLYTGNQLRNSGNTLDLLFSDGTKNPNPGTDTGRIIVDLGSGQSATINFSQFSVFLFNAKIFDGTPHSFTAATGTSGMYKYYGKVVDIQTITTTNPKPVLTGYSGSLASAFNLSVTSTVYTDGYGANKNAFVVFDYTDLNNFKFVQMAVAVARWHIGIVSAGTRIEDLAYYSQGIATGTPYDIEMHAIGSGVAELWANSIKRAEYDYSTVYGSSLPLNDGKIGVATRGSHAKIVLSMGPTNWSPYIKNYKLLFSKTSGTSTVIDILGDAFDHEGDPLTISALSTSSNGALTDNGNGTVTYTPNGLFYGVDSYTFTVSDGTNTNTGTIRLEVVP
jgi:hypothetical protein